MRITLLGIVKKTFYLFAIFLVLVFLATGVLWWKIGEGIQVKHIDLGPTSVRDLFIQYNQGLIIRSDEIRIVNDTPSHSKLSFDDILPHIKKWGYLIREIQLRHVTFKDQSLALTYQNGSFNVSGDNYIIDASITYAKDTFHADLARFEIIPYNVTLKGNASLTRSNNKFLFSGLFQSPWVNGSLSLSEQGRNVTAELSTEAFTDLSAVLDQFPIDEDITGWIRENISARQYIVNKLNVQFSLKKEDSFGPDNISGTAVADSVSVRFHDDLEPVRCDRIDITFKNDRLSFALDKPLYKEKNLDGSSVYIDNIIEEKSRLAVNINALTQYDTVIEEILDKYGIYTVARQQSGHTKAQLELIFSLPEFDLSSQGRFSTGTGEWTIGDLPVQTNGATVLLNNNFITLQKTNIAYKDILRAELTGVFDITSSRASLTAVIDSLNLTAGKTSILQASGVTTPVELDYDKESMRIALKEFDTVLTLKNKTKLVDINSLKAVAPYVPFLKNLQFSQGDFHCSTQDMINFDLNGTIDIPNDFLSRDGKPMHRFDFKGMTTTGNTEIYLNDNSISASITDNILINLADILITVDTRTLSAGDAPQLPFPLEIHGPSSLIRLKKGDFLTRDFIFTSHDSDLKFSADIEEGKIVFQQTPEGISLVGKELNAQLAENFLPSADLEHGKFNIILDGDKDGYNGYMEINNVLFREYLVMNNVFAFLNAIPALATFSSTGFDSDGYRINDAVILFDIQGRLLTIRQFRADGTTVDCEAQGWIDFDERTLKMQMELITLKDYSKIIDKIPLAGYALLGKDGQMSTSLDIVGSLDDPKVETHLTEEILMTPFQIIKRTLNWPFKVYDDMTK